MNGRFRQARGKLFLRRLKHGRVERRRHRKLNGAAAAFRLSEFNRLGDAGLFACDHHLPGRIEIDSLNDAGSTGLTADFNDGFVRKTNDRSHAAHADGHSRLHGFGAKTHELHRLLKAEDARSCEGGIFAERMTSHHDGLGAAGRKPRVIESYRSGEDRGLRVHRKSERFGRTFGDQLGNGKAERIVGAADVLLDDSIAGVAVEHADRLAPLTGENESEAHSVLSEMQLVS